MTNVDAFGGHLLHAAVDDPLLHLEVGDAVAKQAADAVPFLEQRDIVAGARQLLRRRHSGGTRSDDRDALAGLDFRRLGFDPAFLEGMLDDRLLDVLDRDRRLIDAEHARRFARRGTDAAGELGEVVGRVQLTDRVLPTIAIDEIVPVRNDVVDRAAGVAERHAAIHAARGLRLHGLFGERLIDLEVVVDALGCGPALRQFARVLHEPVTLPI